MSNTPDWVCSMPKTVQCPKRILGPHSSVCTCTIWGHDLCDLPIPWWQQPFGILMSLMLLIECGDKKQWAPISLRTQSAHSSITNNMPKNWLGIKILLLWKFPYIWKKAPRCTTISVFHMNPFFLVTVFEKTWSVFHMDITDTGALQITAEKMLFVTLRHVRVREETIQFPKPLNVVLRTVKNSR